jgi:nucleotide-binding universal stress UspA family protein
MLRSILVPLEATEASISAARFGLQLARLHGARIRGLGIVNTAFARLPEPVPLGAMATKVALADAHIAGLRDDIAETLLEFLSEAERVGVGAVTTLRAEGHPLLVLQARSPAHDLIIVGREATFDASPEGDMLPLCVERIVRAENRPVLVVPSRGDAPDLPPSAPILIAYDGSAASSRALHLFALLGLAGGRPVHVVSIAKSAEDAQQSAERAAELLRVHGADQVHAIGLGDAEAGTPSETILGLSKALQPAMIVMGAFGHSGIQEIFGSCTRAVLTACPAPLFLHH